MELTITSREFLIVFALTLFAGLATGVGGIIAFFGNPRKESGRFLSATLGFSAGVMIYISLGELMAHANDGLKAAYGARCGGLLAIGAFTFGLLLTLVIDRLVPEVENPHHVRTRAELVRAEHAGAEQRQSMGRAGMLFALAIGIHNFPEGMATFAGGLSGLGIGIPLAVAIALHNIPEGLAVAVPILYATGSRRKAFQWALLSGLAEPAGALIGFLFLAPFLTPAVLAAVFAVVSGIMVYISFDELLPMSETYGEHHIALGGLLSGMVFIGAGMQLFST